MLRRLLALLAAILLSVSVVPDIAAAGSPPTDPPVVTDNAFIPAGRDLSECVSALPKPGCGSEERSGWRQGLVFGVVVVALALIGWRITRAVRRNRELLESGRGR